MKQDRAAGSAVSVCTSSLNRQLHFLPSLIVQRDTYVIWLSHESGTTSVCLGLFRVIIMIVSFGE